jgi:hypothetical protein
VDGADASVDKQCLSGLHALARIKSTWYGDNMDTLPSTLDQIAQIAELLIEQAEASLSTAPTDDK